MTEPTKRDGASADPLADLAAALDPEGLVIRGVVDLMPGDPAWPIGMTETGEREPVTVVLVGHLGGTCWQPFLASGQAGPNPLDDWSRSVLVRAAAALDAQVIMPNDRPYQPFQQWALRTGTVFRSPLGLLIDQDAGLWHAYRGALLVSGAAGLTENITATTAPSPCDSCEDKPCLRACPVEAFQIDRPFDAGGCRAHLARRAAPHCRTEGCRARDACPVGQHFRYGDAQIAFHMAAFERA